MKFGLFGNILSHWLLFVDIIWHWAYFLIYFGKLHMLLGRQIFIVANVQKLTKKSSHLVTQVTQVLIQQRDFILEKSFLIHMFDIA